MEIVWQLKSSLFMSSPMNMMDPLRTQRRIGMSSHPLKSLFSSSLTLSMAADILLYGMNILKVLSCSVIFSIGKHLLYLTNVTEKHKKKKNMMLFLPKTTRFQCITHIFVANGLKYEACVVVSVTAFALADVVADI